MSEVESLFDFLQSIYGLFGFSFKLCLSTRPEKAMGKSFAIPSDLYLILPIM